MGVVGYPIRNAHAQVNVQLSERLWLQHYSYRADQSDCAVFSPGILLHSSKERQALTQVGY